VRLASRIADDGYGRGRFEVAHAGSERVAFASDEYVGWTWVDSFKRAARSLRWDSDTVAVLEDSYFVATRRIWFDLDTRQLTREAPDALPRQLRGDAAGAPPAPRVVRSRARQALNLGGGGPIDSENRRYHDTAEAILEPLRTAPEWRAWWAATGLDEVDCTFSYEGASFKVSTRVSNNCLTAAIQRPAHELPHPDDVARVARADIELFLERVRARFSLAPHPPLGLGSSTARAQ
jgi:hypothetical protein